MRPLFEGSLTKGSGPQSQTLRHESGLVFVLLVVVAMPVALDGFHRLFEELASFSFTSHASWIVLERFALIHQSM